MKGILKKGRIEKTFRAVATIAMCMVGTWFIDGAFDQFQLGWWNTLGVAIGLDTLIYAAKLRPGVDD